MQEFPQYVYLLADGYSEKTDGAVNRTEMESGPAKQASRSSRMMVPRQVIGQIRSRADKISWEEWFKSIGLGADWFAWVDPIDGVRKAARIRGGEVEKKLEAPGGNLWRISFTLETWG